MGLIRVALCCPDAISISLRRCRGSAPTAVGTELSLGICHDVAALSFSGLGRRLDSGAAVAQRRLREQQPKLEGSAQPGVELGRLYPSSAQGAAQPLEESLGTLVLDEGDEGVQEAAQHVQKVGDAHEVVVTPHGVPLLGVAVLVVVALMLLHQDSFFDSPAVAAAEVAQGRDRLLGERKIGYPCPTARALDYPSVGTHLLPTLLAVHEVNPHLPGLVLPVAVLDVVLPLKLLLSIGPPL